MIKLVNRLMSLLLIISLTSAHHILANNSQMLTLKCSTGNQSLISDDQNNFVIKTSATLFTTPNPSVVGQTISLLAIVGSTNNLENPTGTVEFFDNNNSLGKVELIDGRATLVISTLSVGDHLLTTRYYGNAKFSSSSQEIKQIVTKMPICTTVFNLSNQYQYRDETYHYQVADLNNDNIEDLVGDYSYLGNNKIYILLSSGTSEFTTKIITGKFGFGVVIGDFNNDKKLDLVTGSVVFSGDGDGNFKQIPTKITPSQYSRLVATADLNKDNNLDIIGTNTGDKLSIVAYLGDGNNSFTSTNIITPDLDYLASVTPADINNDTNMDLIIHLSDEVLSTNSRILILLGDGKGQFKQLDNDINVSYQYMNGDNERNKTYPSSYINIAVGDLNNDKNVDIVIALSNRILIYYGNGEGKFDSTEIIGKCNGKIAVSDLNQDGNIDIIASDRITSDRADTKSSVNDIDLTIYFGDGKGRFNKVVPASFDDISPRGFVIGNFNQDSLPDLAIRYVAKDPVYRDLLAITSTYNEGCYGNRASDTALFADINKTSFGQTITFTAKVKPVDGDGLCVGAVSFFDQDKILGKVDLINNQAILKINSLTVATHRITALYSGDINYNGSFSNSLIQNIVASNTSISIASSPNAKVLAKYPFQSLSFPSIVGNELTIMAVVVPVGGNILPAGTVEFFNGDQSLGTAPLKPEYLRSESILKIDSLPLGTHKLSAKFLGNDNFNSSSSKLLVHKCINKKVTLKRKKGIKVQ